MCRRRVCRDVAQVDLQKISSLYYLLFLFSLQSSTMKIWTTYGAAALLRPRHAPLRGAGNPTGWGWEHFREMEKAGELGPTLAKEWSDEKCVAWHKKWKAWKLCGPGGDHATHELTDRGAEVVERVCNHSGYSVALRYTAVGGLSLVEHPIYHYDKHRASASFDHNKTGVIVINFARPTARVRRRGERGSRDKNLAAPGTRRTKRKTNFLTIRTRARCDGLVVLLSHLCLAEYRAEVGNTYRQPMNVIGNTYRQLLHQREPVANPLPTPLPKLPKRPIFFEIAGTCSF